MEGCAFSSSIGVFVVTSRGNEYRRRAKVCFDAAHATENEQTHAALLQLAENWLRMAESYDLPATVEQAQQQQQVQPNDDDKKK